MALATSLVMVCAEPPAANALEPSWRWRKPDGGPTFFSRLRLRGGLLHFRGQRTLSEGAPGNHDWLGSPVFQEH